MLFIVNPISHGLKGRNIKKILLSNLEEANDDIQIAFTNHPHHATEIAQDAVTQGIKIVVAVGGDGTVNEVGKALIKSNTTLGIVPLGSGNGLARHLGIPMDLNQAIQTLNYKRTALIDTATINDKIFLGIAGIGFDAQIAKEFANFGRRGFSSYLLTAIREFPKYHSKNYHLTVDGQKIEKKAFIISFANSSQYGNDFIIAPQAKIQDGLLDLIIVKEIPLYAIQPFIFRARNGTLNRSQFVEIIRAKEIIVEQPLIQAHIDGEPHLFHDKIKVAINPLSLKVIVPIL